MTLKQKKEKISKIVLALKELYPEALCSLEYEGEGWKLMVMGRLSAQCTDERVNIVCRELFSVYPTMDSLAKAPLEDIERIVKPCGLYKMKASSIKASMNRLINDYDGVIPNDMDELLKFEGVGRKIANLLLGDLYHMHVEGDTYKDVRELKGIFRHAHISNPVSQNGDKRIYMKNPDEYDYKGFFDALKFVGCERVSIEAGTDNFNNDVFEAVNIMKMYK